jgi:16S rRNA (cytidine1402-2'-O)-methyltransferase
MYKSPKKLFLIPSTLGNPSPDYSIPAETGKTLHNLHHIVVEDEKTARRFIVQCGLKDHLAFLNFYLLNEHTRENEIPAILEASGNEDIGLLSDAGLPAVADPGALLVEQAHKKGIKVVPLVGPSSILLALMASGLNGQSFAFHGYLPVKPEERKHKIRNLERRAETETQSQIFIETPYRNNQMIQCLLESCKPFTRLCIASSLTLPEEWIQTQRIEDWRLQPPGDMKGKPAVFILDV